MSKLLYSCVIAGRATALLSLWTVFVATVMTVCATGAGAASLDPLSEAERNLASNRARQATLALTGTAAADDPGDQLQVLIAELHVPFGKSAQGGADRLANVMLYDYRNNRSVVALVDLVDGEIRSLQSQKKHQPALNAWEAARAHAIAMANETTVDAIGVEYTKASDHSMPSVDEIESSTLVFTRIFAPDQVNAQANLCGVERCAQITFFAGDDVALNLMVIVNLSLGRVVQHLPFHTAGDSR